jgi:methyl-accepting chemotaxis protein
MHILSRLRLRTKLALLMGLSALALLASIAVASSIMHERMLEDRLDKLHTLSLAAVGIAQALEDQVAAHTMSHDQAVDQLRKAIQSIHFDAGAGYIAAQTLDPDIVIAHGGNPALDGKPSPAKDPTGRSLTELTREALGTGTEAVVAYQYPKPGQKKPAPKVSYVIRFVPWNLVFVVGSFTDDLEAAFQATLEKLAAIGGTILVLSLLTAWLVNRDIAGSLGRLQGSMASLAEGKLATDVPGTERGDEVGKMAGAVLVFKEYMVRGEQVAAEREQEHERAEAAKTAALIAMAETIEVEAKNALAEVGRHTGDMASAARDMSASASRTGASAQSAATAAGQALANAQTVASAAEELSASIREIGGQVSQSSTVVGRAVEAGRSTRETIGALNEQVARIGSVADMISEIAARTNLLALNATIEAARAGDAGKGFAVVASEVKQLATQTAKSTEEISRHITEVRSATGASVNAVERIEETIAEINAIAGSIAAAVEQQSAATAEIARNVSETAAAANEMTSRTTEVSAEAEQTGRKASEVLDSTSSLDDAMQTLQKSVVHLVRTSTSAVDRRRFRRRACLIDVTISRQGRSEKATLHDISERGCLVLTEAAYRSGDRLEITGPRFGIRLEGIVAEASEGVVHINFVGDGIASADADRISLTTIQELMRLAKGDHEAFVKRVEDAVASREKLPPNSLASPHDCRFGRWFDNVSDPRAMELAPFKAIKAPHEAVHEQGYQALAALGENDLAAAQRYVTAMREQSQQVLRYLDQFGQQYHTTIERAAAA